MNIIIDKYRDYKEPNFIENLDQEELEKDFDFIRILKDEIADLDNLKK